MGFFDDELITQFCALENTVGLLHVDLMDYINDGESERIPEIWERIAKIEALIKEINFFKP